MELGVVVGLHFCSIIDTTTRDLWKKRKGKKIMARETSSLSLPGEGKTQTGNTVIWVDHPNKLPDHRDQHPHLHVGEVPDVNGNFIISNPKYVEYRVGAPTQQAV